MVTEVSAPDFDQLANLLIEEGSMLSSPSELHGTIVGQIAAGKRFEAGELGQFCAEQLDIEKLSQPDSAPNMMLLYNGALKQLESNNFELELLLPDDQNRLSQRAEHLGLWVSGFLAGFGLAVGEATSRLSNEAQESLRDLVQIAQVEAEADTEEEESLLMEVEEYVRMAAMLLFTECNSAPDTEPQKDAPTIH